MKNQIKKILILQYVLGFLYLMGVGIGAKEVVLSAFVGCMAGLVPGTYFSMRMLRATKNNNAVQWLGYAYQSEIGKWLITGSIFMLAFSADYPWDPVFLFAGFGVIVLSGWLAPLVIKE